MEDDGEMYSESQTSEVEDQTYEPTLPFSKEFSEDENEEYDEDDEDSYSEN